MQLVVHPWFLTFDDPAIEVSFDRWWNGQRRNADMFWASFALFLTFLRLVKGGKGDKLYNDRIGAMTHVMFVATRLLVLAVAVCCKPNTYGKVRPALIRVHYLMRMSLQVVYLIRFPTYTCEALKLHFLSIWFSPLFYAVNIPSSLYQHLIHASTHALLTLVPVVKAGGLCTRLATGACPAAADLHSCDGLDSRTTCSNVIRLMDHMSSLVGAFSMSLFGRNSKLSAIQRCHIFMPMYILVINTCVCNAIAAVVDWRWRKAYARFQNASILGANEVRQQPGTPNQRIPTPVTSTDGGSTGAHMRSSESMALYRQVFMPRSQWLHHLFPPINPWVYGAPLLCLVLATCPYVVYL